MMMLAIPTQGAADVRTPEVIRVLGLLTAHILPHPPRAVSNSPIHSRTATSSQVSGHCFTRVRVPGERDRCPPPQGPRPLGRPS
jgi:hypothetical protein